MVIWTPEEVKMSPAPRNTVYWWETEPVDPAAPLIGSERADVCIVGAGYTGLWTAYHLKQAEPSVDVVWEGELICRGWRRVL